MKALLLLLCLALPIMGEAFVVTDLSGRQVTFQKQPQRIMLSEGRMLYLLMALQPKHVDNKIVAMADDLKKADTDTWLKVTQLFPRLLTLPIIASPATGQFSAEQAFSLHTDLVLFSLSQLSNLKRSNTLQHLDALNINYLFIDYRANLTEHLLPTMTLLGPIFGQQQQALKFQQFIQQQRDIITTRLAEHQSAKPLVLMERAAGINGQTCCRIFGQVNFGEFVDIAGGRNWGSTKTSGISLDINPETLVVENFDVVIASSGNWSHKKQSISPALGYLADPDKVKTGLDALANRQGWQQMPAIQNQQLYVIWHQFYNHPGYIVAVQQIAKWLHPELFKDINPLHTWQAYHQQFMPFPLQGIFWEQL